MSAHDGGAGESEPLFSADAEESGRSLDGAQRVTRNGADDVDGGQDGDGDLEHLPAYASQPQTSHYPPGKYLKSTYSSREAEFELDSEELGQGDDPDGVPAMDGLLGHAASRGSIDVHRSGRGTSAAAANGMDRQASEEGLIVGGDGKGSILASVS